MKHCITGAMTSQIRQLIYNPSFQVDGILRSMLPAGTWYKGEASSHFKGPMKACYPHHEIRDIWSRLPGETTSELRRVNHPYLDYEWVTKTQLFERICAIFGLIPVGPSHASMPPTACEKTPSPEMDKPERDTIRVTKGAVCAICDGRSGGCEHCQIPVQSFPKRMAVATDDRIAGLVDALWPSIANVSTPGTGELNHYGMFYHHTGCHAGTKDTLRYIIEAHLGLNPQYDRASPTLERIAYGNRRRS